MLSRHLSARQPWKHHHCNEEMKARWRRMGRCSGGGVQMALQRPLALWGTPPNTTELLCTPKVEVSAAKGQALSRHTMGVCSSSRLANEQARHKAQLTSVAGAQLPCCSPPTCICGATWAAQQLAICKMDYNLLLSPCPACSMCVFKVLPQPGCLLCWGAVLQLERCTLLMTLGLQLLG